MRGDTARATIGMNDVRQAAVSGSGDGERASADDPPSSPGAGYGGRLRAGARRWRGFPASLRGRQVLVVAVAILLVLLAALYANREAGRRQVAEAKDQALRLARFIAGEQAVLLESTRRLLDALAEVPAIATDDDAAACDALLGRLAANDPVYANLAVVDADGWRLCGAVRADGPASAAGRAWFERVRATGAFAVGNYQVGRITGAPVLVAAVPVKDGRGRLRRIVLAALSLAWIGELLDGINLPPETRVSVIDSTGVVLARLPKAGGGSRVGERLPSPGLTGAVLAAHEGTRERPGPDGTPHLYGFTALAGTGVHVLVERPKASALAGVYRDTERLLLLLAAAEVLILLGVFVAGRVFLLRPVEALAGAAARLAAGDVGARSGLQPYRGDELGRLARVFDDMARRLQDRQAALEQRGTRAEARFLDAIESVPHAFALWDADDRLVLRNQRYGEFFPALAPYAQPGARFDELVRRSAAAGLFAGFAGRDEAWLAERMARHRRLGEPFEWRFADGRWIEVREYPTAEGGVLSIFTDVSERHAAEAALRESRERLRAALAASGTGTWRWEFDGHVVDGDEGLARLFGLPPEPVRRSLFEFGRAVHPDDRDAVAAAGRRCVREGADFDLEFRVVLPDGGGERWLAVKGRTFRDPDGHGAPRYMTGACVDITRHKRLEEQQRLLLAELSHRVKNTLATVQSIAAQTLRHAPTPEAFAETFTGRLTALAEVHGLLARGGWETASLREAVEQALRPYLGADGAAATAAGRRAVAAVDGPDLTLTPKACLALSLVLHELTTNAAKYGALSAEGGRVAVRWAVEAAGDGPEGRRRRLRLTWRESGGPPVRWPPSRRGFGSALIERSVAYELDGATELSCREGGLACDIAIPWTEEIGAGPLAGGADAGGRRRIS